MVVLAAAGVYQMGDDAAFHPAAMTCGTTSAWHNNRDGNCQTAMQIIFIMELLFVGIQ